MAKHEESRSDVYVIVQVFYIYGQKDLRFFANHLKNKNCRWGTVDKETGSCRVTFVS